MKRIAAVLTVLLVSIFLVAGSATALVIPYWTLSDHTAGDDGTVNFSFTFENASVDNAAFGVFFSNSTFDAITDQIDIFTAAEGIGFSAVANFAVVDAAYSLALTVTSPLHEIVRQSSISDIDPLLFGFYFRRNLDPVGEEGLEDRLIYSDSAYSSNEGQNTMHMVWRNDQTDQVSVQLQYDGVPRYGVLVSDVTPVPEPATMFLLGTGLIGLAGFGRKKFFKK